MDLDNLKSEMRAGVELVRLGHLEAPPKNAHVRRFAWGIALVPGIIRLVMAHAPTRTRFLRTTFLQVAATVVVAVLYTLWFDQLPDDYEKHEGAVNIVFHKSAAFWSSFYVTLCVVEWLVIALARDHHDDLSYRASVLAGVPPEDPVANPKLRLDVGWMYRKLKRRIHGLIIFACGIPVLAFLLLLPVGGDELYTLALIAWGAWWLIVFTVGKTAHAWPQTPMPDPWFLRAWSNAARHTRLLRWFVPRGFLALWRRLTGAAVRPAYLVEQMPFEAAGLGVVRALCSLPGVYLFFRPFIPVAATYALHRNGLTAADAAPIDETPAPADTLNA